MLSHAETFCDPGTGAHTNNVEGIHGVIKSAALAQFNRLPYLTEEGMTYCLDLLIWRENQNLQEKPVFTSFLQDIYFWTHFLLEDFNHISPVFQKEEMEEKLEDEEDDDNEGKENADDGKWFIDSANIVTDMDSDKDYY